MKKIFFKEIFFTLFFTFTLFTYVNNVNADELPDNTLSNYYSNFDTFITDVQSSSNDIDTLLSYYNSNLSSSYPYYKLHYSSYSNSGYVLDAFDSNVINGVRPFISTIGNTSYFELGFTENYSGSRDYYFTSIKINNGTIFQSGPYHQTSQANTAYVQPYGTGYVGPIIDTNFNLSVYFSGSSYSSIGFPYFSSSVSDITFQHFTLTEGQQYPTYMEQYEGDYTPSTSYTTINLNDYSYVALSLRNYNTTPFDTNFMVEGQLCLTPVYNYGMTQKTEYYTGYQVDRCSPRYLTSSPVRVSILKQDIENHSIYYLKAYNTNFPNIIKVDSSVFDITPITSENASSPSVVIDGRSYPTIPYDDLVSSSTTSEEEGYISGQVQNVFDVSSDSNFISNLFSNPLQALETTWASILTMFSLIGSFIGLLPITLQAFLMTAFALGLTIGIIKILL